MEATGVILGLYRGYSNYIQAARRPIKIHHGRNLCLSTAKHILKANENSPNP